MTAGAGTVGGNDLVFAGQSNRDSAAKVQWSLYGRGYSCFDVHQPSQHIAYSPRIFPPKIVLEAYRGAVRNNAALLSLLISGASIN